MRRARPRGLTAALGLALSLAPTACRPPSAARPTQAPSFGNSGGAPSPSPLPATPPTGFTQEHWRILIDLRTHRTGHWATLSDAAAEKILARVYPQPERLRPGQQCDDNYTFQPVIVGEASGSFTGPGRKQTAYFIKEGWCSVPGGESPGAVAVFEGGQLVASVDEVSGLFLEELVDLDQDGIHELLISWKSTRFGAGTTGTSLVSLARGEWEEIHDLGEVLVRECDDTGALEPKGVEAKVLYYVPAPPGTMPTQYHEERYAAACDARGPSDFKLVSRDGRKLE